MCIRDRGRGAGATAYSEEAVMDKMEVWEGEVVGLEVSAKELVVAREGKKGVRSFANRPGYTGWMWRSR